jgi:hypothetical protein
MISAGLPVGMYLEASKSGMLCLEIYCTVRACRDWLRSSQDYP